MKKRSLYLLLPVITLILEILPYGAVLHFGNPEGEPWRKTFSYFDPTPFGYANFAPLLTAILTCVVFVLLIVYCLTGKRRLAVAARNVLCVCAVVSLGPLVFGVRYLSVVGVLITLALLAEWLLLHLYVKKGTTKNNMEKQYKIAHHSYLSIEELYDDLSDTLSSIRFESGKIIVFNNSETLEIELADNGGYYTYRNGEKEKGVWDDQDLYWYALEFAEKGGKE